MAESIINFKNLQIELEKYCKELESLLKVDYYKIKASGDLARSVKCRVKKLGTDWEIEVNMLPYYEIIEKGVKPGGRFPKVNALIQWIKIKKILPRKINGKLPTINSLAFLIGRSIQKKGIKAKPIRSLRTKQMMEKYSKRIIEAIKKDISSFIKEEKNDFKKYLRS